jgi:hypothetical protein
MISYADNVPSYAAAKFNLVNSISFRLQGKI